MKNATPGRAKIIIACVITALVLVLAFHLANALGINDIPKRKAILSQLELPINQYWTVAAHAQWHDILGYIDDYKWSILRHTTRPEEIGSVIESITANGRWRYQQVGWDEIQPIIKLLPADSHGLAKLLPKLHTNYDAWYFDSSALKDGKAQKTQTLEELKAYC